MSSGGSRYGADRPGGHVKAEACSSIDGRQWHREGVLQARRDGVWSRTDAKTGAVKANVAYGFGADTLLLCSYDSNGTPKRAAGCDPAHDLSLRRRAPVVWRCLRPARGSTVPESKRVRMQTVRQRRLREPERTQDGPSVAPAAQGRTPAGHPSEPPGWHEAVDLHAA